jgi:L-threonylcarbamoyladenylate synthase
LDEAALGRVFAAKGRPTTHPLIVHVPGEDEARELTASWNERASRLARAFWPGPLTLVLSRGRRVPRLASGGDDSIALRAPSHPVASALLAALGEPIAAPSANAYQSVSPTLAAHVLASLGGRVELILDGGPCEAGIESTVVDVRGESPVVLRPGAVSLLELRAVEASTSVRSEAAESGRSRASPGMDPRHYAPRVPLVLARGRAEALYLARQRGARGERVGLLFWGAAAGEELPTSLVAVVLPGDAPGYARELYATLHELDARVESILVEPVPDGEAWRAVRDRLLRASTPSE